LQKDLVLVLVTKISLQASHNILIRPRRRRRLEAFTTDAEIIRLTCRLVAFFSDGGGAAGFRRRLWCGWFIISRLRTS